MEQMSWAEKVAELAKIVEAERNMASEAWDSDDPEGAVQAEGFAAIMQERLIDLCRQA